MKKLKSIAIYLFMLVPLVTSSCSAGSESSIFSSEESSIISSSESNSSSESSSSSSSEIQEDVPVEAIYIENSVTTLEKGEYAELVISIYPSNATNKSFKVVSNDSSVISVDKNYNTTIKGEDYGEATITVISNENSEIRTSRIFSVVDYTIQAIVLSAQKTSLEIGESTTIESTIFPTNAPNKALIYSSSDKNVVTVNNNGTVTAVGAGSATITARSMAGGDAVGKIDINVKPVLIEEIVLEEYSQKTTLKIGEEGQLVPNIYPNTASHTDLAYYSDNGSVVTVNNSGLIRGVGVGVATVYALAKDGSGIKGEIEITVDKISVTEIEIYDFNTTNTLYEGDVVVLSYDVKPHNATNRKIIFSTESQDVEISQEGVLKAKKEASNIIITAYSESDPGVLASIQVNVLSKKVASINFNLGDGLTLKTGDTYALTPLISPSGATNKNLLYSSTDETVATVDSNGVITAHKAGTTYVRATTDVAYPVEEVLVTVNDIKVNHIDFEQSSFVLYEGGQAVISPLVTPSNATNKELLFSSTATQYVTVDSNGVISAIEATPQDHPVTIEVSARDGSGVSGTVSVTVRTNKLTSITSSVNNVELFPGQSFVIPVNLTPSYAIYKDLVFSSSNTSVATVNDNGIVEAHAIGDAIITIIPEVGECTPCYVGVSITKIGVDSLVIQEGGNTPVLYIGDTLDLHTAVTPSYATYTNVSYESSNINVATVTNQGLITAVGEGTATIRAVADGVDDEISLVVRDIKPYDFNLEILESSHPGSSNIYYPGDTCFARVSSLEGEEYKNLSVIYSSSNEEVATINPNTGLITAIAPGTTTIRARSSINNDCVKAITFTVSKMNVTSIAFNTPSIDLTIGDELVLDDLLVLLPTTVNDVDVSYTVSNSSIASLNGSTLSALAKGNATLHIEVINADTSIVSKDVPINVRTNVYEEINIVEVDGKHDVILDNEETLQLIALGSPYWVEDDILFTSSNNLIATVNADGVVTPHQYGTVTISATAANGDAVGTYQVNVIPIYVNQIVLNEYYVVCYEGDEIDINDYIDSILPLDATYKNNLSYVSSDEDLATVDENGIVTINRNGSGEVVITISSDDRHGLISEDITLYVNEKLVESIVLSPRGGNPYVEIEDQVKIDATITPNDATYKSLTYSSSNSDVATVSTNGYVTGVSAGRVRISATNNYSGVTGYVDIYVTDRSVEDFTVNVNGVTSSLVNLATNETASVSVALTPSVVRDNTVQYVMFDENIASIEGNVITAHNTGVTYLAIIANGSNGLVKFVKIVVNNASDPSETVATDIFYSYSDPLFDGYNLGVGQQFSIINYPLPIESETEIAFVSSDEGIISVSSTGFVVSNATGSCYVYMIAKDSGHIYKALLFNVTDQIIIRSVEASIDKSVLAINENASITASITPLQAEQEFIFSSNNDAIVSVDENGVVTANGVGSTKIMVYAKNNTSVYTSIDVTVETQKVESITVKDSVLNTLTVEGLLEGHDTYQINESNDLIILPNDAYDKSLSYKSSDTNIATISETGLITALHEGTTRITITAKDGSKKSTSFYLVVNSTLANSVSISGYSATEYTIGANDITLTATVHPSYALQEVNWRSSNPSVISVSSTGVVSFLAIGEATIYADTTDGSNKTGYVTFTVNDIKVTNINLTSDSELTLLEGATSQITCTVLPSNATNKALDYKSLSPSNATVSSTGLITAVSKGTATIQVSATDGSGKKAFISVTVTDGKLSSITVTSQYNEIGINGTTLLTASVSPNDAVDKTVIWSTNSSHISIVDHGNGTATVTGLSEGDATIYADAHDGGGAKGSVSISITTVKPNQITSNIPNNEIELYAGNTYNLGSHLTVLPANADNKELRYTSLNTSVVTVSDDGFITAVSGKSGTVDINISAKGASGVSLTITVTVMKRYVSNVEISSNDILDHTLKVGATGHLVATVTTSPQDDTTLNRNVTWSSSNTNIATVNASTGVVTAIAEGNVTITAVNTNGSDVVDATYNLTVGTTKVTEIDLHGTMNVDVYQGYSQEVYLEVLPESADNKSLTITSSSESTATCTYNNGVYTVHGINAGANGSSTATITLKTTDGTNISVSFTVTVKGTKVNKITATPDEVEIGVGASTVIVTSVTPTWAIDPSLSYESLATSIFSCEPTTNGVRVTGIASGSGFLSITANDGSGTSKTVKVTVVNILPTSVTLDKTGTVNLAVNSTLTPIATVLPSNANQNISWSSSNPSAATVDVNSGVVVGKSDGTATITATCQGNPSVKASFTVNVASKKVTSITIGAESDELYIGNQMNLSAVTNSDATNKSVVWSIVSGDAASINSTGRLTGLKVGTVTVKATAKDGSGVSATKNFTIKVKYVESISLSQTSEYLKFSTSLDLSQYITVYPSDASNKNYTLTANNNNVTINGSVVTSKQVSGLVTITITSNDGQAIAKFTVNVIAHNLPTITVTGGNTKANPLNVNYGSNFTVPQASAKDYNNNPISTIYVHDDLENKDYTRGQSITPKISGLHTLTYTCSDSDGYEGKGYYYVKVTASHAEGNVTDAENNMSNLKNYGTYKETFAKGNSSPMKACITDGPQLKETSYYVEGGSNAITGNSLFFDMAKLYGHSEKQLFIKIDNSCLPTLACGFKVKFSYKIISGTARTDAFYFHYAYDGADSGYDIQFLSGTNTGVTYTVVLDMPGVACPSGPAKFFSFFYYHKTATIQSCLMAVDDFEITSYAVPDIAKVANGYTWDNVVNSYTFSNSTLVNRSSVSPLLNEENGFGEKVVKVSLVNNRTCIFSGLQGQNIHWQNGVTYNNLNNTTNVYITIELDIYVDKSTKPDLNMLNYLSFILRNPFSTTNYTFTPIIEGDDVNGIYHVILKAPTNISGTYEADGETVPYYGYMDFVIFGQGKLDIYIGNIKATSSKS